MLVVKGADMTQKTVDEKLYMALTSIEVAIKNIDTFGRSVPFRWGNNKDVIEAIEHKEVMKVLLYWQREVEMFKELYLESKEGKGDTAG